MRKWTLILMWGWAVMLGSATSEASSIRVSLAMFESGATTPAPCRADRMRGGSGEVSRFQIMPAVWREYTKRRDYQNPELAWNVARKILTDRTDWFRKKTGREPTGLELYLLWNKPGHFAQVGFKVDRVSRLFRVRAQRFANLWQAIEREGSGATVATIARGQI